MENSTVVPTEESPVITALTVIATFGSDNIAYLKLPVAFLGFFLNIFHLFILTRKSMRVTSINVWLIYIAVCDLIILFYAGREDVKTIWEAEKNECTPPETYLHKILSNTLFTCNRTSWILTPWLVIIMATARLLIISNPMSATFEKLSTPLFAIISSIIITLFCSITSIIMLIPVNIVKIREWIPEESCGFPSNYSQPLYGQGQDGWIPSLELIVVLLFIQGLVNIIPVIVLPIVTIILVNVLRKAEKARKKLQRNSEKSSSDHTTKLVTVMTISLLTAEGPRGILSLVTAILQDDTTVIITQGILYTWTVFSLLNSAIHCIICMVMSSQYRNCIKSIFPCLERKSNKVTAVSDPKSVAPSQSSGTVSIFQKTRST